MSTKKSPHPKQLTTNSGVVLATDKLASLVHNLRNEKVLLDSDLAGLYRVTTKALNQAVKRNLERFPEDFMFQLTAAEHVQLNRSQIVTGSQRHRDPRNLPYAFTEQGVAMLSSVLRSPRAVEVNIAIMRTFVQLRRLMDSNQLLAEKIENLEQKYAEHDQNFTLVFDAIKQLITADSTPNKEMGFHAVPETP
jgi:hypothetical protein